jgi:ferredoxin
VAYVVTEACVKCRYTDCVEVCPVACFREGENMVVIDPDECINCDACVPQCPVNAIYPEDDVPPKWQDYVAFNARLSKVWPVIDKAKDPLPEAEEFKGVEDKKQYLSEKPGPGSG